AWVHDDPAHGRRSHLVDAQAHTVELEAFALVRQASQLFDDVPGDGSGRPSPARAEPSLRVLDAHPTWQAHGAVGERFGRQLRLLELITDVAEQLDQYILDADDALHAAKLVHHARSEERRVG